MSGKTFFIAIPLFMAVISSCSKRSDLAPELPDPIAPAVLTDTVKENHIDRAILIQLVNGVRSKGCTCGDQKMPPVGPLTWNGLLEKAAYNHSKDMTDNKYFDHNGLNGSTPGSRLDAVGYNWKYYGENIANGNMDEMAVVLGWLHSPDHCRNIMNGNFLEMGVGKYGQNWTMELGARMAAH